MNKYFEYERAYKSCPHVVLLGAGASVAAIPRGDKNGMKTSVMDGFLEKLGMSEVIADLNLVTKSCNLEDIYSEIAERDEYTDVRGELDTRIRNYFSEFEIPDEPTVYDFLLLSLRKKDLIATFNWDPLLLQAYQRAVKITTDLPNLAFLHGNVLVGYCMKHPFGGNVDNRCPECGEYFLPSRLLYPIAKKNYNDDPFTKGNWNTLKNYLNRAYLVTIFGYSAPKTDVEAIDILKNAWGNINKRNMEDFEFIDIQQENALVDTWKDFVHTHHYTYTNDFFNSSLARFPRRTTEELFDRTQNCIWTSPKTSFSESMTFSDLHNIIGSLLKEENEHKDSYITLKDR
ncbi:MULTISPECIES: hypothetical protein [Morganellaceae]|uniref:hypothetical protein n=1 Tax=Morganellaceae TaxID=1903414 RepID=UPI0021D2B9D3|nr:MULTISPECIES: hypothetical protein [Morganellaceae]ELR5278509.1 hypothetical protein [Providencia rettgeri]MCU6224549.1 hypothetical protein [Morganella morganii]MCU6232241.1 hypothetical protein [Morganella morganii]UYV40055.1 hypothetical protein NTP67_12445 [Providencia rettgeri]